MNYEKLIKLANVALDQYVDQDLYEEVDEQEDNWVSSNIKDSYKDLNKTFNILNKIKPLMKIIYKDNEAITDVQECLLNLNSCIKTLGTISQITNLKLETESNEVVLESNPNKLNSYIEGCNKLIENSFDKLTEVKWFITTIEPDNQMIEDLDICLSNLESALEAISFIN